MTLAIDLLPDLDGLDGLLDQSELVLEAYLGALALIVVFIAIGKWVDCVKHRSEVEKLVRRRPF